MTTHTVIFGQDGQLARHVTPQHVTSATYEITDMSQAQGAAGRVLASGAATAPVWVLTLDGDAGAATPDATVIPVAATTGPELGESAILAAADGLTEPFTISAISSGAYLRSGSLLAGAFAPGSTVESTQITAEIPISVYDFEDAQADGRALRIEWMYTLASGPRVATEPIKLTLASSAAFSTGPAVETLQGGYPDLPGRLAEALTIEALAAYSYKIVEAELERRCIDHTSLMLGLVGEMLLVAKMLAEAALRGYSPGQVDVDKFASDTSEDYGRQLEALAVGTPGGTAQLVAPDGTAAANPDQTYRGPVFAA